MDDKQNVKKYDDKSSRKMSEEELRAELRRQIEPLKKIFEEHKKEHADDEER